MHHMMVEAGCNHTPHIALQAGLMESNMNQAHPKKVSGRATSILKHVNSSAVSNVEKGREFVLG